MSTFVHASLAGSHPCTRCGRLVFAVGATEPPPPARGEQDVCVVATLRGPARSKRTLYLHPVVGFVAVVFPDGPMPILDVRCPQCHDAAVRCGACAGAGCPACWTVCDGEGGPDPEGCPGCACINEHESECPVCYESTKGPPHETCSFPEEHARIECTTCGAPLLLGDGATMIVCDHANQGELQHGTR